MRFHYTRLRLIAPIVIGLALLSTPLLLYAHAHLVRSSPAVDATLTTPPTRIALWFSERPEARFTSIKVLDSSEAPVSLGPVSVVSSDPLAASSEVSGRLVNGRYTVVWRTAGADGHPSTGRFSFTVASSPDTEATVAALAAQRSDSAERPRKSGANALVQVAPVATFSTAVRWAELVAVITMVGAIVFRLAVLPRAGWSNDLHIDASDSARRLAQAATALFAIATVMRVAAQSSLVPVVSGGRFSAFRAVVEDTRWGHGWAVGAAGAAILIVGLSIAKRSSAGWWFAAIGAVAACLSEALTGHSGASQQATVAVAADLVHFTAAGAWLGGLVAVLLSGLPSLHLVDDIDRSTSGARLVGAYHRVAFVCVGLVIASAVVASLLRLGSLSAFVTTVYGQRLLIKIGLVLILLAFGSYHWRRIVRVEWDSDTKFRFQRSAGAELIVGAILLAVTAVLVSTPLPE